MEITVGTPRNTTDGVRHTHPEQIISALVLTSLALLIGGAIALGAALQQRLIAPPSLHARLMGIDVAAYPTDIADCPPNQPYQLCRAGQILGVPPKFYAVWMTLGTRQPGWGYGPEMGQRVMLLRLKD